MSLTTFLKLTGGIGTLVVMWIYLPMMQLIEITFYMLIGLFWLVLAGEMVYQIFNASYDVSQGLYSKGSVWANKGKDAAASVVTDVKAKVQDIQDDKLREAYLDH